MLLLLPPSEGKTAPASGAPLDLAGLRFGAELLKIRTQLLDQLQQVARLEDPAGALGVTAGLNGELAAMAQLRQAPTAPALTVYTGVLYGALQVPDFSDVTWNRAQANVLIASALWGFVGAADQIPAYRLPPAAALPAGKPISQLRGPVSGAVESLPHEVIVDCRSGTYLPLWRPKGRAWFVVKVSTLKAGKKVTVSHQAKYTRGLFAAYLLHRNSSWPATTNELASALTDFHESGVARSLDVAMIPSTSPAAPGVLEIVVAPIG